MLAIEGNPISSPETNSTARAQGRSRPKRTREPSEAPAMTTIAITLRVSQNAVR